MSRNGKQHFGASDSLADKRQAAGLVRPDNALPHGPLPYTDEKPVGAADFYYAINATFRFIVQEYGKDGLIDYWQELGTDYMRPVWMQWRSGGLEAVAGYWKAFFAAEPDAQVTVSHKGDAVQLDVSVCPAIGHLRAGGREIVRDFCQHCYYVSEAAAVQAGYTMRVQGGAGSCIQRFFPTTAAEAQAPQNMEDIRSC